jgi:hypothetical protein
MNNYPAFKEYVSSLSHFQTEKLGHRGMTIDRIDNDQGYVPGNLRWVSMEYQSRNRRKKSGSKSIYIGVSYDSSGNRENK